jgi:hypothetical protein
MVNIRAAGSRETCSVREKRCSRLPRFRSGNQTDVSAGGTWATHWTAADEHSASVSRNSSTGYPFLAARRNRRPHVANGPLSVRLRTNLVARKHEARHRGPHGGCRRFQLPQHLRVAPGVAHAGDTITYEERAEILYQDIGRSPARDIRYMHMHVPQPRDHVLAAEIHASRSSGQSRRWGSNKLNAAATREDGPAGNDHSLFHIDDGGVHQRNSLVLERRLGAARPRDCRQDEETEAQPHVS